MFFLLACAGITDPGQPAPRCADGEVFDNVCVPTACGTGKWGGLGQAEATVFVDAAAEPGGDGSADRPFNSVQEGADAVGGGTLAVAAGRYRENLVFDQQHDGLSIAGRCAALVTVDGSGADEPALMLSGRARTVVGVSGVTIEGGTFGAGTKGGQLSLTNAVASQNYFLGVFAYGLGAQLSLDGVTVVGTQTFDGNVGGYGMQVEGAARVTVTDSAFRDCAAGAVVVTDGDVLVTDSTISDTRGSGVYADGAGSSVTLKNVAIDHITLAEKYNLALGIDALDGASVQMEGVSVSDTEQDGIFVASGASLVATDSSVFHSGEAGVIVKDAGSRLTWAGGDVGHTLGYGVHVQSGAVASLSATVVSDCFAYCVYAIGRDASVQLTSVTVANAQPFEDGSAGIGVYVIDGASLNAIELSSLDNAAGGVTVIGGSATLRDILLTGNGGPASEYDVGLSVDEASRVDVSSAIITDNVGVGVQAAGLDTVLTMSDTIVSRTAFADDGAYGVGVMARQNASTSIRTSAFTENAAHGLESVDGVVDVTDSEFTENGAAGLLIGGTPEGLVDAYVTVRGSVISNNGGLGAQTFDGTLVMTDCEVGSNVGEGILAGGQSGYLELNGVDVVGIVALPPDDRWAEGGEGRGVSLQAGSSGYIRDSTIVGCMGIGLFVTNSRAVVEGLTVEGTLRSPYTTVGSGVTLQEGGSLDAVALTVTDTAGPGLLVTTDGSLGCDACAITQNTFAGMVLVDASADISNSSFADNAPDANEGGGIGIYAENVSRLISLRVRGSVIAAHRYAGLWLVGNGSYDIDGNWLYGGTGVELNGWSAHGNAVFAKNGVGAWNDTSATGLRLTHNTMLEADNDAVLLHDAGATLAGNGWQYNANDVRQQHCASAVAISADELLDVPASEVCEGGDTLIDQSVAFTLYLSEESPTL